MNEVPRRVPGNGVVAVVTAALAVALLPFALSAPGGASALLLWAAPLLLSAGALWALLDGSRALRAVAVLAPLASLAVVAHALHGRPDAMLSVALVAVGLALVLALAARSRRTAAADARPRPARREVGDGPQGIRNDLPHPERARHGP